jgi:3-deoxy-D-manno-octulosonic-acid transferase
MTKQIALFVFGLIYDLLMMVCVLLFMPISLLSPKLNGYRKHRSSWHGILKKANLTERKNVIFYCSSVGEYEQALPLIGLFEIENYNCLVFFHSKSGLDYARSLNRTVNVFLTPFDFFTSWILVLQKIKPFYFIVNRHEFWPGSMMAACCLSKLVIINYIHRPEMSFIHKFALGISKIVFSVNQTLENRKNCLCTGDTRMDRLHDRYSKNGLRIGSYMNLIKATMDTKHKLVVIGNGYNEDLEVLCAAAKTLFQNHRFLFIPNRQGVKWDKYSNVTAISRIEDLNWTENPIVVFNTIGNLFELYGVADIAWVGGGFGNGVHNTLEPAFFHIPVICGPNLNYQKDALDFKKSGMLHCVNDGSELDLVMKRSTEKVNNMSKFENNISSTELIYAALHEDNYSS